MNSDHTLFLSIGFVIIAFFLCLMERTKHVENTAKEAIKLGYIQKLEDGHVLWVKPSNQ